MAYQLVMHKWAAQILIIMISTMQVVLGTLLAALVPVVGFNAVLTSEHFASFLVHQLIIYLRMCSFSPLKLSDFTQFLYIC